MARYGDSSYGTPYGRVATPPTYDGFDRSYGSYSAQGGGGGGGGGGVGDTRRVPRGTVGDNYRRDGFDEYAKKPYPSPAATSVYSSSGQFYRPSKYDDYGDNKDWQKSGGDNYRGEKDEFRYKREIAAVVPAGYGTSRPGHGTGSLSQPTNDIGAAVEILKDTVTHSSASGGYPHTHQGGSRYTESSSTVYYYPEIMPHTMDPAKRYGNINLGSRRPDVAEGGRNYY